MKSNVARLIDVLVDELKFNPTVFMPDTRPVSDFELSQEKVSILVDRLALEFKIDSGNFADVIETASLRDLVSLTQEFSQSA